MTDRPTSWRESAACRSSDVAPAFFFTIEVDAGSGYDREMVKTARNVAASVCVHCPVRVQCGGEAEMERTAVSADPYAPRPFGIRAGYFYDSSSSEPVRAAQASTRPVALESSRKHYIQQSIREGRAA